MTRPGRMYFVLPHGVGRQTTKYGCGSVRAGSGGNANSRGGECLRFLFEFKSCDGNTRRLLPPHRFTEDWKKRMREQSVPPEALPPALRHLFDGANADRQLFQRASSSFSSRRAIAEGDESTRRAIVHGAAGGSKVVPLEPLHEVADVG